MKDKVEQKPGPDTTDSKEGEQKKPSPNKPGPDPTDSKEAEQKKPSSNKPGPDSTDSKEAKRKRPSSNKPGPDPTDSKEAEQKKPSSNKPGSDPTDSKEAEQKRRSSNKPGPDPTDSKEAKQKNPSPKDDNTNDSCRNVVTRACHTLSPLKGIILVATIVLVSSAVEMSKVKPCDLKRELGSLSVDYASTCKYDDMKENANNLCILGIFFLVLNSIIFLLILIVIWIPTIEVSNKWIKRFGVIFLVLVSIGFAIGMLYHYVIVLNLKENQKDTDYAEIKTKMIDRLKASYTSDNVTTGDIISNKWNEFFIKYECCAVNQVQGTTNDFDSTPWCTTSGSCQATASQIPKTCCNGVSVDDYGSAPTSCHSSVTPGTYKSNCMIPVKTLSTIDIEECQISRLLITLLILGTLAIIELLIELMLILLYNWPIKSKGDPETTKTATEMEKNGNRSTESAKPEKKMVKTC